MLLSHHLEVGVGGTALDSQVVSGLLADPTVGLVRVDGREQRCRGGAPGPDRRER